MSNAMVSANLFRHIPCRTDQVKQKIVTMIIKKKRIFNLHFRQNRTWLSRPLTHDTNVGSRKASLGHWLETVASPTAWCPSSGACRRLTGLAYLRTAGCRSWIVWYHRLISHGSLCSGTRGHPPWKIMLWISYYRIELIGELVVTINIVMEGKV